MKIVGIKSAKYRHEGWLKERFGSHVAQISTDTTLKLKSAAKDVARVLLGRVPPEIEALVKKFEVPPQGLDDHKFVFGYEDSGNWVPGSIERDPNLQEYVAKYPRHWEVVKRCLGLGRQKSRHACAFVVANRPISDFIPTMRISDTICTQYTAPSVEAVGGIKMDFLVVSSLRDIGDCIKLLQSRHGTPPEFLLLAGRGNVPRAQLVPLKGGGWADVWGLPEDQGVFADVACSRTETVFQFNTSAATKWLRQFAHRKPSGNYAIDSIEAMSAFTALDRPGPLDAKVKARDGSEHNMLVEYARRARGEEPSETPPIFYELLPETYGIMVYQEQLQRMYQHLTGCTGAEAEEFRSNVAKKKMDKILKAHGPFIQKAGAKVGEDTAKQIWNLFVTWGQYGFNKSHSVCYSIIAYACAYLKHHYPLEWWTSVLRNADRNEINEKFWQHCGHLIDLPDVKLSGATFEIQGNRIRAPLSLLHGVGEIAHQQLVAGAPYKDLRDFCQKVQDRKEREATVETVTKTVKTKRKKFGPDGKPLRDGRKQVFEEFEEQVQVQVRKLGKSAIGRPLVYKLLVSGAMDSILPENQPLLSHLQFYEEVAAEVAGKKKPSAVNESFMRVNQIVRYQMRKEILPAYSAPLLPMLVERQYERILPVEGNGNVSYQIRRQTNRSDYEARFYPFLTNSQIDYIEHLNPFPKDTINAAVVGYVELQRKFTYTKNEEEKHACELVLDVDGRRMKLVKWPGPNGMLPKDFASDLTGAIVIAMLSKNREDRPFGLDDIEVVYPALTLNAEESSAGAK